MLEAQKARLIADWDKIYESEFWTEYLQILRDEEINIDKSLRVRSNDRDEDMFLKGKLEELKLVRKRLTDLVKSIGGTIA